MPNRQDLQPLARSDLAIGRALPFPIFDRNGELLLGAGLPVQNEIQLDALCARGLYRNPRWVSPVATDIRPRARVAAPTVDVPTDAPHRSPRAVRIATDDALGIQVLRMSGVDDAREFPVRLLGVNPGTSLIVTAPSEDERLIFVKEGQAFKFQGMFGESALVFVATVVKVQFAPFPYLHLSWPDPSRIQRRTVRSARRAGCRLPCVVYLERGSGTVNVNGFVVNLSQGGAEVVVPFEAPDLKDSVRIAFRVMVAGRSTLFEQQAYVVRRKTEAGAQDGAHYALQFLEVPDDVQFALHAYILELLVEQFECPLPF